MFWHIRWKNLLNEIRNNKIAGELNLLQQQRLSDKEVYMLAEALLHNDSITSIKLRCYIPYPVDPDKNTAHYYIPLRNLIGFKHLAKTLELNNSIISLIIYSKGGIFKSRYWGNMLNSNNSLRCLKLFDCGIARTGTRQIADALYCNQTLVSLDLTHNLISSSVINLAQALHKNQTLTSLNITNCHLSELDRVTSIAEMLLINNTLKFLGLQSTSLCDDTLKILTDSLSINSTLLSKLLNWDTIVLECKELATLHRCYKLIKRSPHLVLLGMQLVI